MSLLSRAEKQHRKSSFVLLHSLRHAAAAAAISRVIFFGAAPSSQKARKPQQHKSAGQRSTRRSLLCAANHLLAAACDAMSRAGSVCFSAQPTLLPLVVYVPLLLLLPLFCVYVCLAATTTNLRWLRALLTCGGLLWRERTSVGCLRPRAVAPFAPFLFEL
jgi:hypothetical protein